MQQYPCKTRGIFGKFAKFEPKHFAELQCESVVSPARSEPTDNKKSHHPFSGAPCLSSDLGSPYRHQAAPPLFPHLCSSDNAESQQLTMAGTDTFNINGYTATETTEICSRVGTKKANMRVDKIFISSVMGGCYLAFSSSVCLVINTSPWVRVLEIGVKSSRTGTNQVPHL